MPHVSPDGWVNFRAGYAQAIALTMETLRRFLTDPGDLSLETNLRDLLDAYDDQQRDDAHAIGHTALAVNAARVVRKEPINAA